MTTTKTYKDIAVSAITSGYKWLTDTLLSAQQKFNVRPYFNVKIIDDDIEPNAQFFSGDADQTGNGSMITAPDGTIFAVGVDGTDLKVWSSSDLHNNSGVFSNSIVIDTSTSDFDSADNNYSISCSDWQNGTYSLFVYYFENFADDGTNLKLAKNYSNDGGVTWNKSVIPIASIPNDSYGNISVAAMTPFLDNSGNLNDGCFYIKNTTGLYYYLNNGDANYYDLEWDSNANSGDWNLHSLSAFRLNDIQYCVFSGYRTVIDSASDNNNYSLFVTAFLNMQIIAPNSLWMAPISIMPVGSASSTNLNSFILPAATIINGIVYVTFQATTVDSLSQSPQGSSVQTVTTHTNYMLIASDDGISFSYPSIVVGTDGTEYKSEGFASITSPQNNYIYLGGNGYLWESVKNNIVADVSEDVIGYQIQEAAGQPAALNLQISNANNKWVGSSPTQPGAAAIKKNKKIVVSQGYYTNDTDTETVPHSVYYIDDIEQNVTGTENDLTIVCRDFYKKLKTTVSKFSYQFNGPIFFSDIFDGTFVSSWNIVNGDWEFIPASSNVPSHLSINAGGDIDGDRVITLNEDSGASYGSLYRVYAQQEAITPSDSHLHFYAIYIDSDNWLRLDIDTYGGTAWKITKNVAGTQTDISTGDLPFTIANDFFCVIIRKYDYNKFNFLVSEQLSGIGNTINFYSPDTTTYFCGGYASGNIDMSGVFSSTYAVGLGCAQVTTTSGDYFRFFSYSQWDKPNNLGSVVNTMARISNILSIKDTYTWRELFYSNVFNAGTVQNRKLTIPESTTALSGSNSNFSDGEISFEARATIGIDDDGGFSFVFRQYTSDLLGDQHYNLHISNYHSGFTSPPATVTARFERYIGAYTPQLYYFYNSAFDVSDNPLDNYATPFGATKIDITKWNTYRIFMSGGQFWAFCNDQMIAAWTDDNATIDYVASGKWGFSTDANTTLEVRNVTAPNLWKPIQSFAFNAADDAEDALGSLITQLRAFYFSDLFGRFRTKFLDSTDESDYSYNAQLFQQQVDDSDKEWITQVTVHGNGVIATARNTDIQPGTQTREEIIDDYTITTQQDAQTRANNELTYANQYRNQYTPKQIINVGSELFDVIKIINTGNNTSGVDADTRVYAQTFTGGGGSNKIDYSIELDTGNV